MNGTGVKQFIVTLMLNQSNEYQGFDEVQKHNPFPILSLRFTRIKLSYSCTIIILAIFFRQWSLCSIVWIMELAFMQFKC